MRQTQAALLMLALLVLATGVATADYRDGSSLEADAPAELNDRVDALVNHGVASFVSPDRSRSFSASITASEIHVTHRVAQACTVAGQSCAQVAPAGESGDVKLTDATVRVKSILQGYQMVVTNQEQYGDTPSFGTPGPIVATTGGRTLLDATREKQYVSPYGQGWGASPPDALTPDVYTVDANKAVVSSSEGSLRAAGGFEVMFQGLEIEVKGTDADGKPFLRTYRTATTSESSGTRYEFLVVEVTSGVLSSTSKAPLSASQVRAVDIGERGKAVLHRATGTVKTDEGTQEHNQAEVTLPGPLELTITGDAKPGNPPRLLFAISSYLRVLEDAAVPEPGDDKSTNELIAAGAAGAGGATLLASIIYFWPRIKFFLTGLLAPLYTRIQRTEVLEHEKRDEIYQLIRSTPGIHAHEIGEKTRIGWGTTVYHLKLLENHSLVVSKKSGRYKRFFVNTGEFTKKKDIYGALRNETAKAVADFIVNHPGSSQKELCAALGIQPSLASWHVAKLEQVDLVKRVKDGRQVRYFAGAAWSDLNVNVDPAGGAAGVAET